MDNRPIGLLDSGVGGLSVVKKVIKKLPNESTIFIGDNKNMPYGDRNDEEIIHLVRQSVKFLLEQNVKLIIFACNTATAVAMPVIEKEIDPQIIGVIQSGSLAAANATENHKIAVAATAATVEAHAYKKEILNRDPEADVIEVATPKLAPLVEAMKDDETNLEVVQDSLEPLKGREFDTFVMGCTHYPLIEDVFEKILPENVDIIDPADQVAQYTYNVLKRDQMLSSENEAVHLYFTTGDAENFAKKGRVFLQDNTLTAKHVDTENL